MKLRLRASFLLFLLLCVGSVTAQLRFKAVEHNFGTIAEDGGVVEHIFECVNTMDTPIVILRAQTSCGCTKVEYDRSPIMPNSASKVKVLFDPMHYPGSFARKITLVTSEGVLDTRLLVRGYVEPRKRSVEERYPIELGKGVRVEANAHSFGYLEHGKSKQSSIAIINTSSRAVSLRVDNSVPELLFYLPQQLAPNEEGVINFEYLLGEECGKYGTIAHSIYMYLDGAKAQYPLIINGIAIDSRKENADKALQTIVLSENFIKFGAVNCANGPMRRKIEVANSGKEPLIVRHIEFSKGSYKAHIEGDKVIRAGEKRDIVVEIIPQQLPYGAVVDRMMIISTDAAKPVYTVRVSAIVER